ncbi:hypothetical protein CKY47_32950 [Saccharothrix yanglingensis]|uniref:Uncharacterized protein n=1 Tax=Saccharothrix yanglingensis TaxID=659496 RepID=A0ABU0X973_9PSEU|nr:hypothetical protein [Saccharothrix yanglingensis]
MREVRGLCVGLGAGGVVVCAVLASAIVVVGGALPITYPAFRVILWTTGCGSVSGLLLSCLSLISSRSFVRGEHLDLAGARRVRRASAVCWVNSTLSAILSWAALTTVVSKGMLPGGFTGGAWAYLVLVIAPAGLAGVLFFAGRALFPR